MGKISLEQFLNYKKIKDINHLIVDVQYNEIDKIIKHYDAKTIKNRLQNIRDFILNGVDNRWLGRLRIITRKLKNDVISEYSCKIRYGDKWFEKQSILKEKVKMDKNNFILKHGELDGIKKWKERNEKVKSYGLDAAVRRYGQIEGTERWEKTLQRKIQTMREAKKIRPYRNGRTLPEYQNRYGIEQGYIKWKKRNDNHAYRFSLEFYIEKYGVEVGNDMWRKYCDKMKKTTLSSFIERYGKKNGKIRYANFIEKSKFGQSREYYIQKYGDDIGDKKYKELIIAKTSCFINTCFSKISQDLFWEIFTRIDDKKKLNCYFYELNREYSFFVWKNNMTIISVDFKLDDKIIEFDGDYWHSKEEQIIKDKLRDEFLSNKGYLILRIKEFSYRDNKEKVINECLDFLNN
jgi:hypothetical protein